jgi:serum/glucocorticoid-regulated kinase 2
LKIFHIYNEKNLKGFTTTEIDKKRGVSKFPLDNFRFTESDILSEEYTSVTDGNSPIDYNEGKALRD